MIDYQKTIAGSVSLSGKGLHTGEKVTLTLNPAKSNHGIQFQRLDLPREPIIPADLDFVVNTTRSTTLQKDAANIQTVEHVLSALSGMGIDNALLTLVGPETPALDGSSLGFAEAIKKVGIQEQDEPRRFIQINQPISYNDEKTGSYIEIQPSDRLEIEVELDLSNISKNNLKAHFSSKTDYHSEISGARTFCFLHELDALISNNLIKGGDLSNAVVLANQTKIQKHPELALKAGFDTNQILTPNLISNNPLRFTNEPARHKILDLMGDLALLGKHIQGKIKAFKPGHTTNFAFAKIIRQLYDLRNL